jgi:predicted acyltransferase
MYFSGHSNIMDKVKLHSKFSSSRLDSIDQFRGLSILLMVLANYMAGIEIIPAWLKHAPDVGLTVIDLIAPFFIFAIGLTYGLLWNRRMASQGAWKAYQHFFTRFMAIAGIGAILSAGEILLKIDGTTINWGVLQAIGVAGILTLTLIRLSIAWRAVIGLCLLAGYQFLLNTFWMTDVLLAPHGGLLGSISWGGMMILATVLADFFHNPLKHKYFPLLTLLTLGIGIAMAFFVPVSKNRVSFSYVLISLGVSALVFIAMDWLVTARKMHSILLIAWGKNSLALYVLHLLLLGIFFLPGIPGWYSSAPLWLVILQGLCLVGALSIIGLWLERKQIFLSL